MKKTIVILSVLCCLTMAAKSPKRGVSENQFQYKAQMAAIEPGVGWYYTWGNAPGRNIVDFEGLEFVPMCWNASYSTDNIREYVTSHPETKYILGFNEPNFTNQANMTPQEAAEKWPDVQALAKELGLKLVSPALNYSPNAPYQDPLKWMDEFVALVGPDAFDYVAIHSYGGFDVMKTLATNFHDKYGKDVWVTEFCYWPNEGDPNSYVSPDAQIASMMQAVEWLEKTDWIFRYAWFKAIGNSSSSKGPNYGLILSGKGEDPRELSAQGHVYVNMPTFDPEVYNPVNTVVSAADYISQKNCLLGPGANPANPKSIELTQFNAGACVDYQFNVPAAGTYYLCLSVSGQGEPTRFDPTLAVYAVNADETDGAELAAPRQFTLSGSNDSYHNEVFTLTLEAGKQTLRIKDTAPYQPSGIHIATVMLSDTEIPDAAIEEIESSEPATDGSTAIYDLLGRRIERPGRGLYIINNKKTYLR